MKGWDVVTGGRLAESGAAGVPPCDACGGKEWQLQFGGLSDRIHGVPGSFTLWRCLECSTLRLWPVPADMSPFYPDTYVAFDQVAARHGLARQAVLRFAWKLAFSEAAWVRRPARWVLRRRNRIASELLEYVSSPTCSLLDVGCGAGRFLAGARRLGVEGIGIEPSVAGCRVAAQHGVPVQQGTLEDATIAQASYDVVRFSQVLEHLPSPAYALGAAFDILKPGGQVVVICPNHGGVLASVFGRDWFPLEVPRHLWHFNGQALTQLLQNLGFAVESVCAHGWGGHMYKSLRYAMQSRGERHLPEDLPSEARGGFLEVGAYLNSLGQGDSLVAVARKPRTTLASRAGDTA